MFLPFNLKVSCDKESPFTLFKERKRERNAITVLPGENYNTIDVESNQSCHVNSLSIIMAYISPISI